MLPRLTRPSAERVRFTLLTAQTLGWDREDFSERVSNEYLQTWSERKKLITPLVLCRSGDVLALRRRYMDQREGEELWVGMHPIQAANGSHYVLGLSHARNETPSIVERRVSSGRVWESSELIILRMK
jgi:hypothetical protein